MVVTSKINAMVTRQRRKSWMAWGFRTLRIMVVEFIEEYYGATQDVGAWRESGFKWWFQGLRTGMSG